VEKASFDDIVRNLLVYLKGQVPSLQSKTSREDLIRQIQSIVYMLRTSIIQLEGAAFSDPRNTPEYKNLIQEFEGLKRTNQRLEESLFLEMNKTQRLAAELEKLQAAKAQAPAAAAAPIREVKIERSPEDQARIAELEALVKDLRAQLQQRPTTEGTGFPLEEKLRLEADLQAASTQVFALRKDLEAREQEIAELKNLLRAAALENQTEKENNRLLAVKLEQAKTQISTMEFQLGQAINKPLPSRPEDLATIRELREEITRLQALLNARPTQEVFNNMQAAAEAKIAFLEQSLVEWQKKAKERSALLEQAPEQIEALKREKMQLEQRIIDMEATVRRLTASREKALKEAAARSPALRSEEYVFFFEVLSAIANRLNKSPENKDIRQKAEEAIAILERSHAIQGIPTVGTPYDEKLHKVVRSFHTTLVEDNTIVHEVSRGFKTAEHVIQRAIVWIAKSRFRCTECATIGRPQDYFCHKCGMELCAPDGTTKKKLAPLPATLDLCLPLIDQCLTQRRLQEANDLLNYLAKEHPDHPAVQKRRAILTQMSAAPLPTAPVPQMPPVGSPSLTT
jgi:molecular chaperone GrpE (heat shock protein)